MMKIHFHIGQPKTGSSSIQRVLKKNTERLKEQGYLYSTSGIDHQDSLHKIKTQNDFKKFIDDQIEKAITNGCDNIIISDEALFFKNEKLLDIWFENIEENYFAYVYLKRQDIYLESSWKQWHFKNQNYVDFNDYLEKHKVENYFYHIKKWLKYIKKENLYITAFEKRNLGGGLIESFLKMIGVEKIDGFDMNVVDDGWGENKGLTSEGLKLAFQVRELAKNDVHNHTIQNFMSKYFTDFQKEHFESYGLFSYQKRLQLIKENDVINNKISKEILNIDHKLFQDKINIDEKFLNEITPDRIVKALMTIGIQQDIMIKEMSEDIRKIKEQVEDMT